MPSYDSSRGRLRLADRHIGVFAHLLDGETPPDDLWPSLAELQQIGLVGEEGELAPLMRDLLGALSEPLVMITVEVTGEHGPVNHGVIVGQDAVVSHDGWPGEEESEYVPLEPSTLVWELARKVNLRNSESEEPTTPRVETTMGALDSAFVALGEGDGVDEAATRELVRKALVASDSKLKDPELAQFADLVLAVNATWRITTAWDGKHEGERAAMLRALAVWDCGPRGYWIREQPEEPILPGQVTPESVLVLVRSDAGAIWEKVADLLPDKVDLIDEA
ncbi:hypothetical protein OG204_21890 [Streptomyces sp. NBC_01387]|uniref:hypothetical protein n=1 Tax=unclassified Streptomyces TaxID=2593676 RepID=UPI002252AD83|nr:MULTISPECIES: hypothetical protein [unclassified Streptomyces]MCX4549025.1 hypothetical protein [Streptomyces sp. NBC_01500]